MTTPTNGTPSPELLAFQRQVRDEAQRLASTVPGADRYVREFMERVGVAALPEQGTEVTVVVTVPEHNGTVARALVQQQANGLMLPAGWAVRVQG